MFVQFISRLLLQIIGWLIWKAYLGPLSEIFAGQDTQSNVADTKIEVDDSQYFSATINNVIFMMGAQSYFRAFISPDRKHVYLYEEFAGVEKVVLVVNLKPHELSVRLVPFGGIPIEVAVSSVENLHHVVREQTENLICAHIATVAHLRHVYAKISISHSR